ncbi:MAG: protease complex subunit PrcB family protein [Magnetovibrio sp.]|nr:protease complex subunit PrcB family protein [Magnetovibrio sp.]
MLRFLPTVLGLGLCLASTPSWSAPINNAEPVVARKVVHGNLSSPTKHSVHVLRTGHEWREFTNAQRINWDTNIDFNHDMVVAVFLGTRNTSGYRITLPEVRMTEWLIEVTYAEIPPDPQRNHIQALTSPYVLSILPRSEAPVVFSQGHFGTQEVPFDEYDRLVRTLSELAYQLNDERRKNEWAMGRIQDLTELMTSTTPQHRQ